MIFQVTYQQPPQQQTNIPANPLNRAMPSDDFNRYIQEMQSMIADVELRLAGQEETVDSNGNRIITIIKGSTPLVNEAGRAVIVARLRAYLSPNTYMSLIKTDTTNINYPIDVDTWSKMLILNHVKWAINRNSYDTIMSIVCPAVFFALKKAETDKEFMYRPGSPVNNQPAPPTKPWGGLFG